MSKLSFLDKRIQEGENKQLQTVEKKLNILCTIPDEVTLNRSTFMQYLKKYPKATKFGFSKKHTKEINDIRAHYGDTSTTNTIYGMPVQWETETTYLAN